MYQFYGIIDRSGNASDAEHRQSIDTIRNTFPVRSSSFHLHQENGLLLFGSMPRSARTGNARLWLFGEILNESEIVAQAGSNGSIEQALLAMYLQHGEESFASLNGSFLIIIHFIDSNRYLLINDQVGGLQVFIHINDRCVLFASELKYLFCHTSCPRRLDWAAALKRPIPFRVINAERHYDAWFEGIELLEEGSVLDINGEGPPVKTMYWDPWSKASTEIAAAKAMASEASEPWIKGAKQVEDYVEAYMALLDDAVRLRCQSPGSAFSMFSGGVDSTIIAALARRYGDVGTYSFATQATVRDGATDMCLQLARDLDMANTQVLIPFDDIVNDGELWIRLIWSMESPFMHKDAIGKTALHAAISMVHPEVKHIMSGTGSDQLNGGLVRWFVQHPEDEDDMTVNWQRVVREIRTEMIKPVIGHQYDTFWGSRDLLQHDFLASLHKDALSRYPWAGFVRGCVHANQYVLTWDELRAGSWHNRGVRFPFMDHRFIPFILDVPEDVHHQLFFDKQILRQGAKRLLPSYLTDRPKGPVVKPGIDKRMKMYADILFGRNGMVMDMLMEASRSRNMPVDRNVFHAKARQLSESPDQAEWAYVMHLASLMALDLLPGQSESDMDMHPLIMPHVDIIPDAGPAHSKEIVSILRVPAESDVLGQPVDFAATCSLVADVKTGAHFLARDNELVYELDEDVPQWKHFLLSIDGNRSADAICADEGLDMESLREYFRISIEEGILQVMATDGGLRTEDQLHA